MASQTIFATVWITNVTATRENQLFCALACF